jgi:hypothetical protein
MDEGWPLHAAMEMQDGKVLYDEVFWVFPPGHLLPAWIAYALDPPGLVGARIIYAAFSVAACLALFFVARKMMPAEFALLAGLLVAVAAPRSHSEHLLFGYRYLVWSVIVLLLFDLRLTRDQSRWLFLAGVFAGIALIFRLTPAFAVSVAVGVGIVASTRSWRRWLSDGVWYSAGLVLVCLPVLFWLHYTVGLEKAWIEIVVRPVEMTALQSKPMPPIVLPDLRREQISYAFAAFGFRFYPLLFLGFVGLLAFQWGRAFLARRPFEQVFALTFVIFGFIYFSRTMGRSDIPHLDSAIPAAAVLLVYGVSFSTRLPALNLESGNRGSAAARWAVCVGVFATWVFLNGADRFLDQEAMMGRTPLDVASRTTQVRARSIGKTLDNLIPLIQEHAAPEDSILVMAHAPLIYVLADRHSPGYHDVIMPGTFRRPDEEQALLERMKITPPKVVVLPRQPFDNMAERGLDASAPKLRRWVARRYEAVGRTYFHQVGVLKREGETPGDVQ